MASFSNGFDHPISGVVNNVHFFNDMYFGTDIALVKNIRAGAYIYSNEDVFVDDGDVGQVIPSIYNATSESDLLARVNGVLKNYGAGIKRYIGHVKTKAAGLKAAPPQVDFYNYGDEKLIITGGWQVGYELEYSSASKGTDSLYLRAYSALAQIVWVTVNPVDLTHFKTLGAYVYKSLSNYDYSNVYFQASTSQMGNVSTNVNAGTSSNATGHYNLSLDVSKLKGLYYIRAAARTAADASETRAYFYHMWGELA